MCKCLNTKYLLFHYHFWDSALCENTRKGKGTRIMTYKWDEIYVGNHHLWMWCTCNHFFSKTWVFLWCHITETEKWMDFIRPNFPLRYSSAACSFTVIFNDVHTLPPSFSRLKYSCSLSESNTWQGHGLNEYFIWNAPKPHFYSSVAIRYEFFFFG